MGEPADIHRALMNAAMRLKVNVAFIRRQHSRLGNETDLPVEIEQALTTLTAWAGRLVAENSATVPKSEPRATLPEVEPGPLASRPRPRHPLRRTRR